MNRTDVVLTVGLLTTVVLAVVGLVAMGTLGYFLTRSSSPIHQVKIYSHTGGY